jgi:hypothetical protein
MIFFKYFIKQLHSQLSIIFSSIKIPTSTFDFSLEVGSILLDLEMIVMLLFIEFFYDVLFVGITIKLTVQKDQKQNPLLNA